jgi:hypothetical protein
LAEAESTAKNLSIVLAGISLKAGKAIEKAFILIGQLEEVSLFLVIAKEEETVIIPKIRYIICRLVTLRV